MERVEERFRELIQEGERFNYDNFAGKGQRGYPESLSPEWFSWTGRVQIVIDSTFGPESPMGRTLSMGLKTPLIGFDRDNFHNAKSHIIGALKTSVDALSQGFPTAKPLTPAQSGALATGRIFVVHGHDDALKTELEVFLTALGLEPVVLHRQPDQGATLLEKFERHADVGYAFVLLTPDELAFAVAELSLPDAERRVERRARPNVIFEFGFFVGRLGRSRVCCLFKGDVTLPSDLTGLVYKRVDSSIEGLGFALIKELKAAGYAISL